MKYLKTYEELTKKELESELNDFFEAYYDDYDSVLFEPSIELNTEYKSYIEFNYLERRRSITKAFLQEMFRPIYRGTYSYGAYKTTNEIREWRFKGTVGKLENCLIYVKNNKYNLENLLNKIKEQYPEHWESKKFNF